MDATISPSPAKSVPSPQAAVRGSDGYPVLWFAALGLVILVVILSAYGQWVLSDNFRPSPTGSDPLPPGTLTLIRTLEVLMPCVAIWFWWTFLVNPWRKAGRITWDGIFLVACATIWFQDPIDNYFNFTFAYNAHFFNMASWAIYIPGWEAPRQNLFAEPILFMGGMFMWLFFGGAVFGCWFLRSVRSRWPSVGFPSSLFMLFLAFFAADLVAETLLCRTGLFGYPGTYHPLTLWAGRPYQFPLYEPSGIATVCIAVTLIRHFRDDHGQSLLEKGVAKLRYSQATKSSLSFLALLCGIQLAIWAGFYLPYTWFALKVDSFPKMPSYMTMTICGKDTGYACPSREVPIPSLHSLAIRPDDPRLAPAAKLN